VFCDRKSTCDILSEIYNDAPKYYSNAVNKDEALKRWRSGLMLATGAFGVGVNVNGILWIFHWGLPKGLIDFDQEVGRGGRGGEVVRSVILLSESMFRQQLKMRPENMEINQAGLRNFTTDLTCRRITISRFFDDETEADDCEGVKGEICDRCGGIMSEIEREIRGIIYSEQVKIGQDKTNGNRK
jgi:superfamily II DNA helicase RecQ